MATEALYSVEKACSICKKMFVVTKVRSRLVMVKQDTDFCTMFKDINPYYYTVWACPHCGYAAQDKQFDNLPAAVEDKIIKFLNERQVNLDLSGIRSREQAVTAYKLAIFYAEMAETAASNLGGLYLRLAWLYREGQLQAEEQLALKKAVECYEQALYREHLPIGTMSELTLTYLIGELFHRVGELDKSLQYFSKVVASPQGKMEKRIVNMARDAWQQIRADRIKTATAEENTGVDI